MHAGHARIIHEAASAAGRRRSVGGSARRENPEAGDDERLRDLRPNPDHGQASLQGHT